MSLQVREGEFFALLGENGAGKSTAMYCFLGLLRPTAGSIRLFGAAPEPGSSVYAKVAYLPEEPHYHLYLTVEEAVSYYGALFGRTVPAKKVGAILDRLGLAEFRQLRLSKCSKGMKQKVGIAQCLLNEPRMLFLDEPMRGLDPFVVKEFRDILLELHRGGATIVMNSHMLAEVEAVATRVAILAHGRVAVEDSMANILNVISDTYDIEFEADGDGPPFFILEHRSERRMRGTIPASRFYDFMDYARDRQALVHACAVKRSSLEDSFLAVVKGSRDHA
jgi:ABC-2 type transport system ATP-binding protein